MIFEPGKNIYFSTYPSSTLIHLSHRFTNASEPATYKSFLTVVSATSVPQFQVLRHQRNHFHPGAKRFTWQTLPAVNRTRFFKNILCIESFRPQHNAVLRYDTLQAQSPFWLLKPASEHKHARLPPRLLWSWTVLLPSDTNRKPITSTAAALFPFVTYLLTLPLSIQNRLALYLRTSRNKCKWIFASSRGWRPVIMSEARNYEHCPSVL
jgi:hypothetical protein